MAIRILLDLMVPAAAVLSRAAVCTTFVIYLRVFGFRRQHFRIDFAREAAQLGVRHLPGVP
jgi:hypothetical protein